METVTDLFSVLWCTSYYDYGKIIREVHCMTFKIIKLSKVSVSFLEKETHAHSNYSQ